MNFKPTSSQMSFYTGNKEIDSYLWNQGVMQVFSSGYTYEQLNDAFNKLVQSNDSLRVKIKYTEQSCILNLEEYRFKKYPHWILSSEQELEKKSREFLNDPIDFNDDNVKCAIFETPNNSGIMISGHHMFVDGYSVTVMTEYINKYLENPEFSSPLHQKYSEYTCNEEKYRDTKRYLRDSDFWQKEFSSMPICSIFPESNNAFDYTSSEENFHIGAGLFKKIKVFCDKTEISVQSFFNSVYAVYLYRAMEHSRFTLGIPVLNRTTEAELNTIGLYMHMVPLVVECKGNSSFFELSQIIENSQLNLFRHQKFTQHDIKEMLEKQNHHISRLFDVATDYQEFQRNDFYDFKVLYSNSLSLPLEIHMQSFGSEKHNLKIRYRTSMFSEKEIQTMINSMIAIAEDALENPDKKICELSMLSAEEKQMIVYDFNNTAHSYDIPEDSTLYSLFERTAIENEDKICIRTSDKNMTFGELLEKSGKLDTEIRRITGDKKSVVAVIAERSPEMYSAIYGIIRGGNAYLPIDPDYPQERIEYILENSEAKAVVVQGKFINKVKNTPVINMTELLNSEEKTKAPLCAAKPEDTAYVIYTSGSTGNPKGAKVSHRSAVNRILWMHDKYPLLKDDVILQKTPYTFDVSVWEHFWWGMCGGSLAVSKPGEHFLPAKILDETSQSKVTHIHFVPSVFELFLNYLESHRDEISKFNSVRYVFLSGEALTADLVQRFYKLYDFGKVTLHNLYGPTECAVDVTYYDCVPTDTDPVPIGKPVYNTQIHILDKYLKVVPVGVVGELCIAGENVGQGYLNNPELTAEKFVDNPFGEGKMYRTGDNAYFREDGNIIFVGRKDNQIKLNGQRIEVGEIEAVISCLPEVKSVAVVARKIENRYVLVAFYTGEDNAEALIKDSCVEKLPKYMVPSYVVQIGELPLNQSGKLDRKALLEMPFTATEFEVLAPVNETEKYICSVFSEYFTEESIGRNSDFFDLGGTSLTMISVLGEDGFENVTAAEFMRNPTPEALARLINKNPAKDAQYLEPLFVPGHYKQVMILLPFAGGGAEAYSNFVACLKKLRQDTAIYFIRYLHSAEECECAATEIAEFFCDKDILFYSHCVGSAVAIQIISNLEKQNISVKHYFAAASIPPEKPSVKNIWRGVPDKVLNFILSKAGARINSLSSKERKDMIIRFRKDTDFANISFANFKSKIKVSVSVILTRRDIFTYNYRHACKLWKNYAEEVENIYYINSKTHYFQSENSEELVEYMLSYIK